MKQLFIKKIFTAHFNLRSKSRSNTPSTVFLVVRFKEKQFKLSTGVKVKPVQWLNGRAVEEGVRKLDLYNNRACNSRLREVEAYISEIREFIEENPEKIDSIITLLKNKLKGENDVNLKTQAESLINNSSIKNSSKLQHLRNFNKFFRFSENNITLQALENYKTNLLSGGTSIRTVRNIYKGTLLPYIKKLIIKGYINNITFEDLEHIELPKEKSNGELKSKKQVTLTEEEFQKLYKFNPTLEQLREYRKPENLQKDLIIIRDLFILQFYSGQRMSDLKQLLDKTAVFNEKLGTATVVQKKTGNTATVILNPLMLELINKYTGKNVDVYFNTSKCNRLLKLLAELSGMFNDSILFQENGVLTEKPKWELIHTHTARHSFITEALRRGIDKNILLTATGHTSTVMIEKVYSHLTKEEKAERLVEEFNKKI